MKVQINAINNCAVNKYIFVTCFYFGRLRRSLKICDMNIWIYITVFALGLVGGMVIHWLLVRNKINSTEITVRKVKQKKTKDSNQDVTNQITALPLNDKAKQRKIKRQNRKKRRAIRKISTN